MVNEDFVNQVILLIYNTVIYIIFNYQYFQDIQFSIFMKWGLYILLIFAVRRLKYTYLMLVMGADCVGQRHNFVPLVAQQGNMLHIIFNILLDADY